MNSARLVTILVLVSASEVVLVIRTFVLASLFSVMPVLAGGTYFTPDQIQKEVYNEVLPSSGTLWITPERRSEAEALLGKNLMQARIRYKYSDGRYLWTLSEIGKEKPITFAVVTTQDRIERIEVMVFREVRGDEIRLPQYTAQYQGLSLTEDGQLSGHVDGISGATYSVRTMQKIAKLALLLQRWASEEHASAT